MSAAPSRTKPRKPRRSPQTFPDPLQYVDLLLAKLEDDGILELVEAELARRQRIRAGLERACLTCGCSETRGCPGGCLWASENLCSRCL